MQTIHIVILVFGFICLCIFAVFMAQARERARIEKIRKTNQLSERHRRMQQLLYDLPPQYLNNELRIMIAQRSVDTVNELIKLQDNTKLQKYLADDVQFLTELKEKNPTFKPVPIQTEAKAKEVRNSLEVLHKFIETQLKQKRVDVSTAICQSRADLFIGLAEASMKTKPRVAIHNLHSAIDAYKEFSKHPQAVKVIASYRIKIKELEALAVQNSQKLKDKEKQSDTTEQNLEQEKPQNKEWDKFLDDDKGFENKKTF